MVVEEAAEAVAVAAAAVVAKAPDLQLLGYWVQDRPRAVARVQARSQIHAQAWCQLSILKWILTWSDYALWCLLVVWFWLSSLMTLLRQIFHSHEP